MWGVTHLNLINRLFPHMDAILESFKNPITKLLIAGNFIPYSARSFLAFNEIVMKFESI